MELGGTRELKHAMVQGVCFSMSKDFRKDLES
jgi:hypothetical protein